jgi:hypothetical protein
VTLENICFRKSGAPAGFDEVLAHLKQNGCNLLVTGEVAAEVSDAATRRFMGAPYEDRKRVLALADAATDRVDRRLPGGCGRDDPDVRVVARRNDARSAAATAPGRSAPADRVVESDLRSFREAICDAVAAYDHATDGLDPAQLRLSVDSLRLLLDYADRDEVERFLRGVTALVAGVDGMAHYHLPVADDDVVAALTPLFDARIELRRRGRFAPEQRWHVPAFDERTDWVRL